MICYTIKSVNDNDKRSNDNSHSDCNGNQTYHFKFNVNTDPTAYNPDLKGKRAALDHFFYRHNSSTPVKAVLNPSDIPVCDIINNPSDHAPVYLQIHFL